MTETTTVTMEEGFRFIAKVAKVARECDIELERALRFLAALSAETAAPTTARGPERPQ